MIPKRIALVGPVASGKSTLAAEIAGHTGLPHLDLDGLFWGAGWTPVDTRIFQNQVRDALGAETWIADGNYSGAIGEMLLGHAQLAIWLDLPLRTCLPRLLKRSFRRAARGEELFAGNRETFRHLFARDSILLWGPAHHRRRWQHHLGPQQAPWPVRAAPHQIRGDPDSLDGHAQAEVQTGLEWVPLGKVPASNLLPHAIRQPIATLAEALALPDTYLGDVA